MDDANSLNLDDEHNLTFDMDQEISDIHALAGDSLANGSVEKKNKQRRKNKKSSKCWKNFTRITEKMTNGVTSDVQCNHCGVHYFRNLPRNGTPSLLRHMKFAQMEHQLCFRNLPRNVTMFTALSHENLMHEDICMLALDQTTSMIVVPSGRTWTTNGELKSDDVAIRRLNISLLERAPCCIGILIDRGKFLRKDKRKESINVCAIFIGGKDDRGALSRVNRMKHNLKVQVAVIRLISNQEIESTNWDYILVHEIIKELKNPEKTKNIAYTEKTVTGGPEVATMVQLLAEEYDLMVVGRNHGMS